MAVVLLIIVNPVPLLTTHVPTWHIILTLILSVQMKIPADSSRFVLLRQICSPALYSQHKNLIASGIKAAENKSNGINALL